MYKQEIKYRVLSEIRNEYPYIKIGIRFNDYFTQDSYYLESATKRDVKKIPFILYKNESVLSKNLYLIENNIQQLIENALGLIDDYDLKKLFLEEYKTNIIEEVNDFMDFYEKTILLNEVTLEGELRRMKVMAGITPQILT